MKLINSIKEQFGSGDVITTLDAIGFSHIYQQFSEWECLHFLFFSIIETYFTKEQKHIEVSENTWKKCKEELVKDSDNPKLDQIEFSYKLDSFETSFIIKSKDDLTVDNIQQIYLKIKDEHIEHLKNLKNRLCDYAERRQQNT